MSDYRHALAQIPPHQVSVGRIQVLAGQQSSVFWVDTDPDCDIAEHSHPMEQITWLISGRMDAKIGAEERRPVEPGTVLLIPGGVRHQFWYLEKCSIVEFAAPPRLDWFPHAAVHPYGLAPADEDAQS